MQECDITTDVRFVIPDEWDVMEQMTEEERLQLAIEMSKMAELEEEEM